jgi:hypothetical protein
MLAHAYCIAGAAPAIAGSLGGADHHTDEVVLDRRAYRNMKKTAPIRQRPAHRKLSVMGCRM